ncbi:pre-mRNA cleavage and polyadenylation factor (CPF) complex subunit [Naganishia albida]|nr:pre-mRNA cleavage and polyadenylation factor (CPF) complex subunit [Naganishia albida]
MALSPPVWKPKRYLEPTHPPPDEQVKRDQYEAALKASELWGGGVDFAGRPPKLLKPRRTVDYAAGVGRYQTLRKIRAGLPVAPIIHPSPNDMCNLLPPLAYRRNPLQSICDVFIHSSMNKERNPVSICSWNPEGRWCVTGNQMGQFTIWNAGTYNFESLKQAHDHPIYALSYTHSGQFFLSADNSGALKYFTPTINNLTTIQAHREACRAISFSPNDEKFATGGDDGAIKVWTFGEAKEDKVLSGHGWDVRSLEWHPSKGLIVSGSKDLLVKFWDPRMGKDISTLHSHRAVVNATRWSPDGNLVATAGGEGVIRLFDIRTFKELDTLKGHKDPITALAWHPIHNSVLTSGSYDGSIGHWNLNSSEPTKPVTMVQEAHDQVVWSFAYHPLGHVLASTSRDCSVRFWCRARPPGGQEIDRWHVGDATSQSLGVAKYQQADEEEQDEDMPLPGLSAPAPAQPSQNAPSTNTFSLPGLSVPMPPPTLPPMGAPYGNAPYGHPSMPPPGFQPQAPPGGLRRGPPLPSQQDMLNQVGAAPPPGRGRRSRWGQQ